MGRIIILGQGGAVDGESVIAIGNAKSAPIKRLLASTPPHHIIDLTYGYPRLAVLILKNGMVVLVSRTPGELARAISTIGTSNEVPWWE